MTAMPEEVQLESKDGTHLVGYRWRAPKPKATLVLLHGYCDHAGRYPEFVQAALQRHYSVAAVDLRGHGKSEGKRGHTMAMDHYLDDLEAWIDRVEKDGGPLFLIAHSMGGLISIRYVQSGRKNPFLGVVLSSPYLGLALKLPAWKPIAGRLMSKLWPAFSIPTDLPLEALSRNTEAVARTAKDPLYGRYATARTFTEQLSAHQAAFQQAAQFQAPVLFLVAGSDTIADPAAAKKFFEKAGSQDKRFELLAPMYHEIFADPDREQIFDMLFPWLEKHLQPSS